MIRKAPALGSIARRRWFLHAVSTCVVWASQTLAGPPSALATPASPVALAAPDDDAWAPPAVPALPLVCPAGSRAQRRREGSTTAHRCLRRRDHVAHGPYLRLRRDGSVDEHGAFRDGKRHGPWLHRFRFSSDAGSYVDGVRQGRWRTTLDDGCWHQLSYLDGRLHGPLRKHLADGTVVERQGWEHGAGHGAWDGTWPGGRRRFVGSFDHGARVGRWQRWHADGALAEDATWIAGRLHGAWRSLWPNGQLQEVGGYDRGQRVGLWRGYHPSGALLYEARFADDDTLGEASWRDDALSAADAAEDDAPSAPPPAPSPPGKP